MYFSWKTIGHERQKKEIENNILNGNLSHAYLFSGPENIGKFYFAKEIASALLCPNNMCKTCITCRQIQNLTHSDFLVLDLLYIDKVHTNWDEISKYSNIEQKHRASPPSIKTNTITIEDIRMLQKQLYKKPISEYKICIIKNIDRLNTEATNSFLKSVEEPSDKTIFIFTTAKEASILPTLLSRLRIIRFNLIHNDIIEEHIKDSPNKKEILEYAQGRITTALRLARNSEELQETRKAYEKIVEVYEKMNTIKRFAFAESLSENMNEMEKFFEYSLFYLRSKIDPKNKNITKIIELLDITQNLIKKNINKRLALENFFLEIVKYK